MNILAWDVETYKIRPGIAAPKLVCVSSAWKTESGVQHDLFDAKQGIKKIEEWLNDESLALVAHNGEFDLSVACAENPDLIPLVYTALNQGRLKDTLIREKLYRIATGKHKFYTSEIEDEDGEVHFEKVKSRYTLDSLVWEHFRRKLQKKDTWRLRYSELDGVPIDQWPTAARDYAIMDSIETLNVFYDQEKWGKIPDEHNQSRAPWPLRLKSCWGLRTDPGPVNKLKTEIATEYEEKKKVLQGYGFVRCGEKQSKDTKKIMAAVVEAYAKLGKEPGKTKTGLVSTDADTLKDSEDERLKVLLQYNKLQKTLTSFVPILESGTKIPITCSYNSLVESGRTSCAKPNMQNLPRKGDVRQCFVPRPGWVYVACDLDTAELRSWSQVCLSLLGESEMAEVIKRGEDIHSSFAAVDLLGISYEEFVRREKAGDKACKDARDFAKVPNFGVPGGLGVDSFIAYAHAFGYELTREQAQDTINKWKNRWRPDRFFKMVGEACRYGEAKMTQLFSGRIRGGVSFTQMCNGYFQGLTADLAKSADYRVSEECYVDHGTALFGCRPVIFVHDEIVMEVPYQDYLRASEAAKRLQWIMVDEGRKWLPDVPTTATPVMTRRWYKGAKPVYVNGVLVPSKPLKSDDGKVTWVQDAA